MDPNGILINMIKNGHFTKVENFRDRFKLDSKEKRIQFIFNKGIYHNSIKYSFYRTMVMTGKHKDCLDFLLEGIDDDSIILSHIVTLVSHLEMYEDDTYVKKYIDKVEDLESSNITLFGVNSHWKLIEYLCEIGNYDLVLYVLDLGANKVEPKSSYRNDIKELLITY